MTKRLVASLLALLVVLSLGCFAVFADEESGDADVSAVESVADENASDTASEDASEVVDDASEGASEDASEGSDEASDEAEASDTSESDASGDASASTSDTSSTDDASTGSTTPWGLFVFLGLCVIFAVVCIICIKVGNPFGQRISKFLRDYKSEFKKITWLGPKDLLKQTALVLVVLIVAAAVLGLLDWAFSSLINLLVNI